MLTHLMDEERKAQRDKVICHRERGKSAYHPGPENTFQVDKEGKGIPKRLSKCKEAVLAQRFLCAHGLHPTVLGIRPEKWAGATRTQGCHGTSREPPGSYVEV